MENYMATTIHIYIYLGPCQRFWCEGTVQTQAGTGYWRINEDTLKEKQRHKIELCSSVSEFPPLMVLYSYFSWFVLPGKHFRILCGNGVISIEAYPTYNNMSEDQRGKEKTIESWRRVMKLPSLVRELITWFYLMSGDQAEDGLFFRSAYIGWFGGVTKIQRSMSSCSIK